MQIKIDALQWLSSIKIMLGLKIRLLTLTRRWMHLFINEFESITLTTGEFLMQIFMIVTKHRKQDTSGVQNVSI
jgi:hypothetical protein